MILKNLFFPPKCIFCRKVMPIKQKPPNLCDKCRVKLPFLPIRTCPRCGKAMDAVYEKPFCPYCAGHFPGIRGIVSPFLYKEELREAILCFKFRNRPYYAQSFAPFLLERLNKYNLTNFDALIPVPVSKQRLKERGYDQCAQLAKALSVLSGIPVVHMLRKTMHTPRQSTLNKAERQNNPKKAFEAIPTDNPPKTALLLDDIYTTGATTLACAAKLRKEGVKNIYICTVAMHLPYITNVEEDIEF